jgi:hypothetical protein
MNRVIDHPRLPQAVAGVAGLLLVAALVGLASVPTGADTPQGTVPDGRRVAASTSVGDVEVMVLSTTARLNLLVAYHGEKGWHGIAVDPAPPGAVAAWAATRGGGEVPALSAVYGRATGAEVRVRWADGQTAVAGTASDGTYLAARPGLVRSSRVTVLGDDGAVLSEVKGP